MWFEQKTNYINLILTNLWKSCTITFPAIGYFHSSNIVLFTHRFIPTENQSETRRGNYAFRHRPDFYFYRYFGISPLYT